MQIHQDEAVASATPFRKAVSFRDVEGSRHHPGRTPLRESNGRTPMGTPHSKFGTNSNNNNNNNNNNSTTPFKSPSSTKKASVTSNSFRQGLKKGCTPSKAKENSMESNQWSQQQQQQQQQYHFNQKPMPKTPSSASALRRTLRSTIQPQEKQPQEKNTTSTSKQPQKRAVTLNTSSNIASDSGPFRSVATATAMSYSSSYATSSLLGRSRLLGKGGLAPGNTTTSGLGPATRVAPKTPNTLLRTELENDDDEFDESFLLSPPPGALWNALNLNSGARGDKRHTISPTVTTGLIVVSPQAAEQIHTWSSTKKQLSSFHSSPKDRVSPTVPRALMQTPHTVVAATTSTTMTSPTPTTTTPLVQNSSSKSPISELETCEEGTNTATTEENLDSVAKEDEALFVVTTDTGIQSTTDTTSTDSAVGTSEAEKMLQRSVKKSTKGGIAMDMTSFFCLEENEPLTKNHNKKKWIESEPLSSSMPPALLSRLSSSKKISQTKETKLPPMVSKVSSKRIQNKETKLPPSSKLKPTSTETKLSVKRSTTIMTANDIKSKSAAPKKVMKLSKEKVSKDTVKPWKRQDAKNTLRAENKTAAKNAVVKPWKKQVTTKNPLVAKKKASSVTSQKAPAKDVVKPWKKQAANHTHVPKGPEKNKSASTDTSAVHQERSMATESSHSGGMAFDVAFSDVDNTKMQLQTSMNRTRMRTKSSATIKTKESSSRSSSWADKQCEVFVGWLNYTLNPEEMDVNNTGCIVSGLRALIIHRRLAEGRINALNLFKDRSMLQIRTIIAKEIARGRLSIRADRDISVDVHLRKKLTSLLLSYTTPWLRLALEVMCGEIIEPVPISESSPKTYLGRMKLGLELFIKRRFLSDDNTLQKFTKGRSTGLSGAFETRYKGELRNLVLSRIMVLVFFLDRAKASNVLENVPRLFTISSNVKSTRDVLVTICRDCLSAEGDIVKHLSRIGLKISYIQDPVDEVNFRVTNLATDVRDGVLLTRLSEIVTGKPFKSSMSSLRLPAVSRLQKKFNVNLAFSAIKDFGITIAEGINAHHIMDGHREMVLALMWCIIAHCCLDKLLHGDQVEQEIRNVIQSSLARKKLDGRSFAQVEQSALQPAITSVPRKDSSANGILKDILLRWSQAVCSSFGVAVNDLSESFADGKALCLLVHYYHPSLIHLDEIFPESGIGFVSEEEVLAKERVNWKKASKSMRELGGIPDMLPICDSENPPNEQSMLLCLSYLCSRLMESSREIFATILIQACYRKYRHKVLMEKKFMAAKSIFRIWTLNKDNYFRQQEERFKISVATLENFVLSHKHALKRMKKARLEKDYLTRSVTDIQRVFRGSLGRVRFDRLLGQRNAAIMIQRNFRRYVAVRITNELSQQRDSAIVIQSTFRRFIAHEKFLDYRYFIIEMQRTFRGYITRKELKAKDYAALVIQQVWWSYVAEVEMEIAAICLQKTWRGLLGRRKWIEQATYRDAASVIQKVWRGYNQSLVYSITLHSAIVLQKMMRGFLGRKAISVNRYRNAATSIQKLWRGFSVQVQYQIDIFDIVCVQSLVRRFLSKRDLKKRTNALSILQCAYRCSIARDKMAVKIQDRMEERLRFRSAVIIQAHVRTLIARQNNYVLHCSAYVIQSQWRKLVRYRLATSASTKIQSMCRSRKCRSMFMRSKMAAINLQRFWRGFASRKSDKRLSFAATLIQSAWRRYWVYTDYTIYVNEINSATLIQAHVRRMATMRMIDTQNSSARTVQLHWLKYKQFKLETNSATKVQAFIRSKLSRLRFLEMKSASIVVQQMARARQARNILSIKQKQRQFEQSAIILQRVWRGFSVQVQYQMDVFDIICVQSIARRYIVSRAYKRGIVALSTIQRAFRCAAARRERALRKLVLDTLVVESSIKIQTAVRGLVSRSKFLMMKAASIDIQKNFRGHVVRKHLDSAAQNATVIQSNWRMYQLTKNYKAFLVSATKIQACFRLHSKQSKYLGMKEAAVCIQRCWRGSASRDHLSKQYRACTMIQSNWRRSFAQNNYLLDLLEIKCATVIQSSFRMYMHRMDYLIIKYSAQTIQRFTRGLLSRVDLKIKNFAAAEIQRIWRGHCTCSMKSMVHGAIKIQSVTRMTSAKKKVDALRILQWAENRNRNKNASVIQDSFRKYTLRKQRENAAKIIQTSFRSYSELKRIQRGSHGVIALQSRFRGAQVRKKRSKRLFELERRIQKETKRALLNPTLRLGYRTSRALEILQTSQSLTKIMAAVKELESSTRLSVVCCQVFTKANAANILLYLIQSCNRSVPHMELKEHILLTLENVAQYSSLVGSFAHYKYAEVFLDNVQVFRDKDGIFCLAVMLLGRITQADKDVAQFCATHEHLKRLKEVYRVASRRRIKSEKNKVISEKARRLRKYGLAKRDDFDRKSATRLLREMIDSFSEIEVPHITKTPSGQGKGFNWNELLYSPLI